jgi:hypothetical protein
VVHVHLIFYHGVVVEYLAGVVVAHCEGHLERLLNARVGHPVKIVALGRQCKLISNVLGVDVGVLLCAQLDEKV